MSGSACTHAARDKHGVVVHQCVLLLICQWGLTFFKAEHVNWSVVSRCRSRSKKVLNDKCARVFVSFGMRGQSLFFNSRGWHHSWSGSLYIAAWWCKNFPQPLSCLTAAIKVYCHFFPLRPIYMVLPVLTTTTLCNLYHSFVSFTSLLSPWGVYLSQGGPRKSQLSEIVGFMTRWRVSLLETVFKESRPS